MDFAFTDEQQMIAETAHSFFAENATSERTRKAMAGDGIDRALWQAFCQELALSGIGLPESGGGAGLGMVELAIIAEAAGAQVAALPMLGSLVQSAQAIAAGGHADQQAQWLPHLISGEAIAGYFHDAAMHVDGDRLTGGSPFVAHGASADIFVVTDMRQLWIIRADAPGVSVTPRTSMDQTRPFAHVRLENAPGERLADPDAALAAAHRAGFIVLAAEALGGAQACLDRTVAYSMERVQFGRPIGSFQAYKHRLADMMIEIEQARSAVFWAACAVDEAVEEAAMAIHAAKSFATDTFFRCAGDMIQLHGGIGFTWEHDAHLFFKRARSLQTMLGNNDWHREKIATMILGEAA
ncbi:Acyl-CoA dehydrogenase domain-containing protein [Sphingobium herbicidovorans NBRC 16415]|uniref:Acyl-CoA dehydrogenase domain-containing protein n=1 Tax=Sphingobium herbicidovorans (strain ATCC 700291 / DSM 11019 / CCUG 56400 / KCTC 2939 / LMG 18315 / NBRC 16415 / MH) TaxID=1219045 RepID=A0A086PEY7_SPHHM|nr:acyl-CoA dehydrogenase family protein [Sphingobium herbicidovorans]KFG91955.1 Acyl-CoA dehydrogenase domain-containing protein [Sphingobium herbicidovorans NBRC 16415]